MDDPKLKFTSQQNRFIATLRHYSKLSWEEIADCFIHEFIDASLEKCVLPLAMSRTDFRRRHSGFGIALAQKSKLSEERIQEINKWLESYTDYMSVRKRRTRSTTTRQRRDITVRTTGHRGTGSSVLNLDEIHFIFVMRRYTTKIWVQIVSIFNLEFSRAAEAKTLQYIYKQAKRSVRERAYISGLTIPMTLDSTDSAQAMLWLQKYAPEVWASLTNGTLKIASDCPIRPMQKEMRFVLLFKTYTSLYGSDIQKLLQREFNTTEKETEWLFRGFSSAEGFRIAELKNYASKLKVPTRLQDEEFDDAKSWLLRYSPNTWTLLQNGNLTLRSRRQYTMFTAEQTRFILVLRPFLRSRQLVKPFLKEFERDEGKNLTDSIQRRYSKALLGVDEYTEYIKQLSTGALPMWQYLEAKSWIKNYAPDAMTQGMQTREGFRIKARFKPENQNNPQGSAAEDSTTSPEPSSPNSLFDSPPPTPSLEIPTTMTVEEQSTTDASQHYDETTDSNAELSYATTPIFNPIDYDFRRTLYALHASRDTFFPEPLDKQNWSVNPPCGLDYDADDEEQVDDRGFSYEELPDDLSRNGEPPPTPKMYLSDVGKENGGEGEDAEMDV